jgi:hypothetical protein
MAAGAEGRVAVSCDASIVGPIISTDLIGRPLERNPAPGGIADLSASRERLD